MDAILGYTLTQVSKNIDCPPPFINRVQRQTGLFQKKGKRGQEVYFTSEEYVYLKIIYGLRKCEISFEKIKELFWLEEEILDYNNSGRQRISLIIHPCTVSLNKSNELVQRYMFWKRYVKRKKHELMKKIEFI